MPIPLEMVASTEARRGEAILMYFQFMGLMENFVTTECLFCSPVDFVSMLAKSLNLIGCLCYRRGRFNFVNSGKG